MAGKKKDAAAPPFAADPAAKAPKAEKAEKPPRIALLSANGVTRPRAGSKTATVWEMADAISAKTKAPAARGAVMEACKAKGINEATVATQYGKWRRFNGLARALPVAKAA